MALLLCFFWPSLRLDGHSREVSLLYLGALALVTFRVLARLAVLSDFEALRRRRAAPSSLGRRVSRLARRDRRGLGPALHGVSAPAESLRRRAPSPAGGGRIVLHLRPGGSQSFSSTKHSDRILFRVDAPESGFPIRSGSAKRRSTGTATDGGSGRAWSRSGSRGRTKDISSFPRRTPPRRRCPTPGRAPFSRSRARRSRPDSSSFLMERSR